MLRYAERVPLLCRTLQAAGFDPFPPGHPLCVTGRSPKWPAVRDRFLKANPVCCVSGLTTALEVHHVKPYHLHPELELDPANLPTVSRPYHFLVGHLCDWAAVNAAFDAHAAEWRERIAARRRG
jgi:hypothetical protein